MKTKRKPGIELLQCLFFIAAAAVLIVGAVEWLPRRNIIDVLAWMAEAPKVFLWNLLLSAILLSAFTALTGAMLPGIAAGAVVLLAFGLINMLKIMILQSPFFAWDLLYIKQMTALVGSFSATGKILGITLLAGLLLGMIGYPALKGKHRLGVSNRLVLTGLAVLLTGAFAWASAAPGKSLRMGNMVWNQALNYETNGAILSFSLNISPLLIKQPQHYDRTLVNRLVQHNRQIDNRVDVKDQPVSLIFFMSESFSDFQGVLGDSADMALKHLNQIAGHYPRFQMISPTFAGGTSLVEFEALTGLSLAFLPCGAIPFDHYLRRPVPSIASVLREHGYHNVAIHPYFSWFWSRDTAYPNLGFHEYLSIDQFENPAKRGFYVSDEALVDKIIETIGSAQGPYFIHAVSMENHGPYPPGKFKDAALKVDGNLPEWLQNELGSYLPGLSDADAQLERLLNYLSARKEPVICVFFGDHQPSFGAALLAEKGMMRDGIEGDYQLAEVPGLIWSNRRELIDREDIPEQLSPAYLPMIVLHQMGIPLPGYLFYMKDGLVAYPVVHRKFVMDGSGALTRFDDHRGDPYMRGLEILNYDILFGAKFSGDSSHMQPALEFL